MRCTNISFSNLWLYHLLNVSKDTEQRNVIPEGGKPTQNVKGEIMGHDELKIINILAPEFYIQILVHSVCEL
jgi:hypothetical protein